MTMTVYAVSGAPRAWRVLAGLTFKELEYDIHYLEASKGEHKAAEYLEINPRGTVPSLVKDDLILRDSIGILAWLDREFPKKPLFGRNAAEAANIWQNVLETVDYLRAAHNDVFFSILVQGIPVTEAPSDERKAKDQAADKLRFECERLEKMLAQADYLCGDYPTAADAVAFPDIRLIQRAMEIKPDDMVMLGLDGLDREFPKLEAWKSRVEALPGMSKTLPPHWSS
ncbi:glutathione S-transferase family protein [Parasphingorhabdus cellanae]|uniref:Glutathione S-transferase family protein n=1 Tax=Parasphingorhabdus cellanae TaxID=2806553 RepID=A0ABX7T8B1_9SPHN|nr:glutathione S-transferase family protein [Parasphingorhabdus cellanae]QTD57326.1 glutathione S-transferase family protein [Parasphingorhabdus cellanae]